jgi:diguanylate cyclase (GGDEF)-like protein/PAS domain S-box-containing protein/putative nucleotidyltransferase with HDIG domain
MDSTRSAAATSQSESTAVDTDVRICELSSLLAAVEESAHFSAGFPTRAVAAAHENHLAQVRLGIATSLFLSLKAKHGPSATHCLRVAISCSSWAMATGIEDHLRDEIELAALLHDIGKIGVPDYVLMKPGKLTAEEQLAMDRHRRLSVEILSACSASQNVIDIVENTGAWYNGCREGFTLQGDALPLGARMVSIIDAFDAMTTDHVYRRALSRERAIAELFEYAGTQFDPHLVRTFCSFISGDPDRFQEVAVRRWLTELRPDAAAGFWRLGHPEATGSISNELVFHHKLLDSMADAVVFVDPSLQILYWNRAAEQLTGIAADAVVHKNWNQSLVNLSDASGVAIGDAECPLASTIASCEQTTRRCEIRHRSGAQVQVDLIITPVVGKNNVVLGAALLLHDATSQISLEQRVQTLHEKATRDPLTGIANRAEFDRAHRQFVVDHLASGVPCSLIICDLDFFKKVNDTYGHQAGDEALISFTCLLRRHTRTGDLVARYGGEEFVLLCADCDNATATKRAQQIRLELSELAQPMLGGRCLTASFGVTEVQNGDTPEAMLRRSDRALLQAKDNGRNQVVQLGVGLSGKEEGASVLGNWLSWFRTTSPTLLIEKRLVTAVPLNVSVEKLRGFVADHHAEILSIDSRRVVLRLDGESFMHTRRNNDRLVPFLIEVEFDEINEIDESRFGRTMQRTLMKVVIRPKRDRDRRKRDAVERAKQLFTSLKSYLIAQEYHPATTAKPLE